MAAVVFLLKTSEHQFADERSAFVDQDTGAGAPVSFVSVIVPVYNDAQRLSHCLDCLDRQSYPKDCYEIVVVDNGSTDEIGRVKRQHPDVRWLVELTPGSYAARNRGLQEARGDIFAFTDADCLPTEGWIEGLAAQFRDSRTSVVGGGIELINTPGYVRNVYELLEEQMFGLHRHRELIEFGKFGVTANLAVRRQVFAKVGRFNAKLKSSGDREWTRRAVHLGESLLFADRAVVRHPRRSTFRELRAKQLRIVGGQVDRWKNSTLAFPAIMREAGKRTVLDVRMFITATKAWPPQSVQKAHFVITAALLLVLSVMERARILAGGSSSRV